uniref:Putative ovule protein n=1 Tax=Solanum chacoense TaxID=4108 RepID=A0A0V0I7K2_SOLCH
MLYYMKHVILHSCGCHWSLQMCLLQLKLPRSNYLEFCDLHFSSIKLFALFSPFSSMANQELL